MKGLKLISFLTFEWREWTGNAQKYLTVFLPSNSHGNATLLFKLGAIKVQNLMSKLQLLQHRTVHAATER